MRCTEHKNLIQARNTAKFLASVSTVQNWYGIGDWYYASAVLPDGRIVSGCRGDFPEGAKLDRQFFFR